MIIPDPVLFRFGIQPAAVVLVLDLGNAELAEVKAAGGGWSAREHLAHLARHAEVFLERIERILAEDRPALGRYKAEEDPGWPAWAALSWDVTVPRWWHVRAELTARTAGLLEADLARTGVHPVFGELTLGQWLDFFLMHEGHHLYTALVRLGEARAMGGRGRDAGAAGATTSSRAPTLDSGSLPIRAGTTPPTPTSHR